MDDVGGVDVVEAVEELEEEVPDMGILSWTVELW